MEIASTTGADRAAHDKPWRRPGKARYARLRLRGIAKIPVTVTEPEPGSLVTDHDVGVITRDGTVLRVNAYRPPGDGPFPVLLCAHPYGKDRLPKRTKRGRYQLSFQYRVLRQASPMTYS